jgi:hypothetical protein
MADPDHDEPFRAATAGLVEAFVRLRQSITKALNQNPTLPLTLEDERELHATVLVLVGKFVAIIDPDVPNKYFFELASALTDLNKGIVRPLTRPSPQRGRAPDPSNRWRDRARVALALDAFMRSGLSKDGAAAEIARTARKYSRLRRLAGKKAGDFATTVIDWRSEFSAGRVDNFEATELFAEGSRRIGKMYAAGDLDELKRFAADRLEEAGTSNDV